MAKRGENFIPWEQIEPLLRPGMTGHDLMLALVHLTGLHTRDYRYTLPGQHGRALRDALKGGIVVVRRAPDGSGYVPPGWRNEVLS